MATRTPPSTKKLHENLGAGIRQLVAALPPIVTYEVDAALGKQIAALVAAAVKSALPGRQKKAQITAIQEAARQSFARGLARKVKKLEA